MQLSKDVNVDKDRTWYDLPNISTVLIEIDIDKSNLSRVNEFLFAYIPN